MAKYQRIYETVNHIIVEVTADSLIEADWLFDNEKGTVVDIQETTNISDTELVKEN